MYPSARPRPLLPARPSLVGALGLGALLVTAGACQDYHGPQYVDALGITPTAVSLEAGQTATVEVVPLGPRGEEYPDRAGRVEWSITSEEVATWERLDGGALRITGVEPGVARLEGRLGRASVTLQVTVHALLPDQVRIEPASVRLTPELRSTRVTATVYRNGTPLSPDDYEFDWSSGNSDVVLVLPEGPQARIIGRRSGSTVIRVSVGGVSATVQVTVDF